MKTNYLTIISVAVVLLVVSGCGPSTGKGSSVTSNSNIFSGTQGVQLSFLENMPPGIVYVTDTTSDSYSIKFEAKNKGAYPQPDLGSFNMKMCLSGYDPNLVVISNSEKSLTDLEGVSVENPNGGFEVIDFASLGFNVPTTTDGYSTTIKNTFYYDYGTILTQEMCLDPDPTHNEEDTCTVSKISLSGQGAPVAVTGIELIPSKGKAIVKIDIQNKGNGRVITKIPGCNDELGYDEYDEVQLSDVMLGYGSATATCEPNPIRLVNNQGSAYCKFESLPSDKGPSYKSLLSLAMKYSYKDSISKSIQIKRI